MGKATSTAAARPLAEIIDVLAENLRRSLTQNFTTAYLVQINNGQHNNIFFIFS